jgi:hypothetical protein
MHKPSARGGGKGRDPAEVPSDQYTGRCSTPPVAREDLWKPERVASDRTRWETCREIAKSIVVVAKGQDDKNSINTLETHAILLMTLFPEKKDALIDEWARLVVDKARGHR